MKLSLEMVVTRHTRASNTATAACHYLSAMGNGLSVADTVRRYVAESEL
jgi:hypothetical protein